MLTLSIVERFLKKFSLFESWLNLLQNIVVIFSSTTPSKCCHFILQNVKRNKNDKLIIHYSTLKINHTVKLVNFFEKMFNVSSVVLDNSRMTFSIHQCCCWWKSESSFLSINRTRFSCIVNCFKLASQVNFHQPTALINENNMSRLLSRTMELI